MQPIGASGGAGRDQGVAGGGDRPAGAAAAASGPGRIPKAAAGLAVGSSFGAIAGGALGGGEGAAIAAAAAGVIGGAVGLLGDAKNSRDAARQAGTAMFELTAAFASTAGPLTAAFAAPGEVEGSVIAVIQAHLGRTLTPAEAAGVRAVIEGASWWTMAPAVGLVAGSINGAVVGVRSLLNKIFVEVLRQPPAFMRVTSPGYARSGMDFAALCLAIGAGVKAGIGTMNALEGHPILTTAASGWARAPWALTGGICASSGFALSMLATGLAERRNGGLSFGPAQEFTLRGLVAISKSRMIALSRATMAEVGGSPVALLMMLRQLLTSPGAFSELLGENASAVASFALMALTIHAIAKRWFNESLAHDGGSPGVPLSGMLHATEETLGPGHRQTSRLQALMHETLHEAESQHDGDVIVAPLRDVFEVMSTFLFTSGSICAAFGAGDERAYAMTEEQATEILQASAATLGASATVGLVFQIMALMAATGSLALEGLATDDRRAAADFGAIVGGSGAGLAASLAGGLGVLPGAAAGIGAGTAVAIAADRVHRSGEHEPRNAVPEVSFEARERFRRAAAQMQRESWVTQNARDISATLGDAWSGRPPRGGRHIEMPPRDPDEMYEIDFSARDPVGEIAPEDPLAAVVVHRPDDQRGAQAAGEPE